MSNGLLQIAAGASLVVSSGLLTWDSGFYNFRKNTRSNHFNLYWRSFDQQFGRAAMWNTFSTGAELLLKGLLLHNEQITTGEKNVWQIPERNYDLDAWALRIVQKSVNAFTPVPTDDFDDPEYCSDKFAVASVGELNGAITAFRIWHGINTKESVMNAQKCTDEIFLVAAFDLLRSTIRNRDTHAYVPNVREQHEWLANELFIKAFNICLNYLSAEERTFVSNRVSKGSPRLSEKISDD